MARALLLALALLAPLVAGCGGDDAPDDAASTASASSAAATTAPAAATTVAASAGEAVVERIDVGGGNALDVVLIVPPGFDPSTPHEVVLALPPGGQDLDTTERVATGTYAAETLRRGWVVASPVAPGPLFFDGSEALLPGLMDALDARFRPPGGRFVLIGVSNGGLSAFRIATLAPERFSVLVAFPGYAGAPEDEERLPGLAALPVRLFVGGDDAGWLAGSQDTVARLEAAGGDATLEVIPGEGHIIGALRDGSRLFAAVDAALAERG